MIHQKLLLAFAGKTVPPHIVELLKERTVGGFTLFRSLNIGSPAEVRELTDSLQRLNAVHTALPLLIGADQEGGQLMALGEAMTQFPGNMALGATGSTDLARQTGWAVGRECAALGINLNYAPVCDVNSNPQNPVVGVRSFGESAEATAVMAAAFARGLQSAGIAGCAKHFPGHGDTVQDSHLGTPSVSHDRARLDALELLPFKAVIEAGIPMMMTAHISLPALNNGRHLPATLSRPILHDLLRQELGFAGVVVSDALDMGAIHQGAGLAIDVLTAVLAGVDLLMLTTDPATHQLAAASLAQAYQRGLIPEALLQTSGERILRLKQGLTHLNQPDLDVIGCAEHQKIAQQTAEQAITLVRNRAGLLPLRLPEEVRILVIVPRPADLTPADTSSYVTPELAAAIRAYHAHSEELIVPLDPTPADIAAITTQAQTYDLLIIGTISASHKPAQAAMVAALLALDVPAVTVALRTPYDLASYPQAQTHLCSYSIQPVAMHALAAALWGQIPLQGRLPTQIPGLYAIGDGRSL